jgi:xylan 1,4-beta-xylosidase
LAIPGRHGTRQSQALGGSWTDYIKHYDHTVQAVTGVIPNAWIGPGNFVAEWLADEEHEHHYKVRDFVSHCAEGVNYATGEKGSRMTFLAFSAYVISGSPKADKRALCHDMAFSKAREMLDEYPELNKYLDNDAMPGWFTIEAHEYGDPASLNGKEWLWMTEWMAGFHAYVMDLAYNSYGVYKTCFWFQSQWYNQMYPYVRVNQMLDEMQGGALVEVKKNTTSERPKVEYGAISAWKDGSLYVLIYNFNWDPLHQGTLRGKRTHTIDNTITLTISGKSISAHSTWALDHKIINERSGNGCWYYELKADLDAHPDLEAQDGNYYVRFPKEGWRGPVEEVIFSRGAYANNGLYEKYQKLSEIGIVGSDVPVSLSEKRIIYTSENFTQSGVQLLKFSPASLSNCEPE